ncbi:nucleotide-binding protein [Porphyromonas sp.]|uniref:nucleotide-binding protein n=1 Tax=Porphyromonas sp. TaxID=1924944 RepID=UPI001CB3A188|nr:nucleotide-binding protein [Porphyromonas sp.]MBF1381639.1 nucleotide-binding protein [Porphyromonas sp.]
MPYYHVLIKTRYLDDLSELDKTDLSQIKEEIIIPFLKGDKFYFGEYLLDKAAIITPIIKTSDITCEKYATELRKIPAFAKKTIRPREILQNTAYFKDITRSILMECQSLLQEATPKSNALTPDKPSKIMDTSQVFIVHGHDNLARLEVANFIKSLGLKDIVLNEQASSGKTIIEKIEEYSDVGFAIVLYTPCDVGASQRQKDQLRSRARQNVVFEHGYLMAKIGRKNVCPLVKGDIETPNDISGVVYIKMDEGDGWKLAVAKEMKKSGYDVDLNKI